MGVKSSLNAAISFIDKFQADPGVKAGKLPAGGLSLLDNCSKNIKSALTQYEIKQTKYKTAGKKITACAGQIDDKGVQKQVQDAAGALNKLAAGA